MPTIYAIGETVYDIIFRDNVPVAAKPGGSMLNSAVSLGRSRLKVQMITELGDDHIGRNVLEFLNKNGVSTSFIRAVPKFKTPISLAFLDKNGNARYSFYKNYPPERLTGKWPEAERGDIVLFGSFYSLDLAVRSKIISFIKKSIANGALIIYDPNIRKNHLTEIKSLMPLVEENISLADIVRGSDEDFENLFGLQSVMTLFDRIKKSGCRNLIVTQGENGLECVTDHFTFSLPAKKVETVSTIGAGDAFNAGVICGLSKMGTSREGLVNINEENWKKILGFGTIFASDVCGSFENYISKDLLE